MSKDTKKIGLRGKIYWAKIFEGIEDKNGPDGVWRETQGRFTVTLHFDEETKKVLEESGSGKQPKIIEEGPDKGMYSCQFDRPVVHPKFDGYGGPPRVVKADGRTPIDPEEDGYVANESEGVVYLSVYKSGRFTGTRLDGVQVVNHIPYHTNEISYPDLSDQVPSTDEDKPKKVNHILEDDEIPFG